MLKNATGAMALVLLAAVTHAQPAYRVKDISQSPDPQPAHAPPREDTGPQLLRGPEDQAEVGGPAP